MFLNATNLKVFNYVSYFVLLFPSAFPLLSQFLKAQVKLFPTFYVAKPERIRKALCGVG